MSKREQRHGHDRGRGKRACRHRARDAKGRFTEEITDDDLQEAFETVRGPVVTTTDVADVLGISTEAARQKLNALVDTGELKRRKTGRTVLYWHPSGNNAGSRQA